MIGLDFGAVVDVRRIALRVIATRTRPGSAREVDFHVGTLRGRYRTTVLPPHLEDARYWPGLPASTSSASTDLPRAGALLPVVRWRRFLSPATGVLIGRVRKLEGTIRTAETAALAYGEPEADPGGFESDGSVQLYEVAVEPADVRLDRATGPARLILADPYDVTAADPAQLAFPLEYDPRHVVDTAPL